MPILIHLNSTGSELYNWYRYWLINQYTFIVHISTKFRTILEKNKCDKCNLTIHPNFIGNHKCDHVNCPICKSPITPSQYWFHVRSHPGHENDSPSPPKTSTFANRQNANYSGYRNYHKGYWRIIPFWNNQLDQCWVRMIILELCFHNLMTAS